MKIETRITVGLILLPIIGSVIGYVIGYHVEKRKCQKLYWKMTEEEVERCKRWVRGDEHD